MVDPSWSQSRLRNGETGSFLAKPIRDRHTHVVVTNLGMACPTFARLTHDRNISNELITRRIKRNDDLACLTMSFRFGVGHGHDDGEGRTVRSRREPLVSVDDVGISIPHGCRFHDRRIRAGRIGLGHGKATSNLSCCERAKIFVFLLGRSVLGENLHVSRIRSLTVEDEMGEGTTAEFFADERELHKAESHAAELPGDLRAEVTHLTNLRSHFFQARERLVEAVGQEAGLERNQFLVDECTNSGSMFTNAFRNREIHGKLPLLPPRSRSHS